MRSKEALDKIIRKSRVHLYKPIQIAEILYQYRHGAKIKLDDIETYRNISKKWRDDISKKIVGRVSTSSQKFQDNLFEENAMPPSLLKELGEYNSRNNGIVETYIYYRLKERLGMVSRAVEYVRTSGVDSFSLNKFLSLFVEEPGLKRSVDKVYEIVVYALFSTIVRALEVEVCMEIKNRNKGILTDFSKFIDLVLRLSKDKPNIAVPAKLFRVGVTNAADRGLDMWTNFGPAIQVKHISLSEELAEDVSESVYSDNIILVCKEGDAELVKRITTMLPLKQKIQGIITLEDLTNWYAICLSSKYKNTLGKQLLQDLIREFDFEFPVTHEIDSFFKEREYNVSKLKGEWAPLVNGA